MKSELLKQQLAQVFGASGKDLVVKMRAGEYPSLQRAEQLGVGKLFGLVDNSYTAYAGIQQCQRMLSGDVYSDWNLLEARIHSGQQWQELLGYLPKELDDKIATWQGLVHPEHLRTLQANIAVHVMQKAEYFEAECQLRAKNGNRKWLLIRGMITARLPDGKPARMLVLQRDLTASKEMEERYLSAQKSAADAKAIRSKFIANISHEIRTPMNGIIGMTDLALDTSLSDEQRHYLHAVKSSSVSLMRIINDLLDFSRIETGNVPAQSIDFRLHKVVKNAVRALAIPAHKKGLELTLEIAPDVPNLVTGDATILRRVLINLVDNAVKFTERGDILVSVSQVTASANSSKLIFSVTDTGIGVPENRQQAIFEAFAQADDSITRPFGGAGLGLTICARLVQSMGGKLELTSQQGKGSCFFFTMAFKHALNPRVSEKIQPYAGKRALLLAPNENALRSQLNALRAQGLEVMTSGSAHDAAKKIAYSREKNTRFDFIVADSQCVSTSENALINDWHRHGKSERLVWVINSDNQSKDLAELRQKDIVACVVKPVSNDDLAAALELADRSQLAAMEEFTLSPPELPENLLEQPPSTTNDLNILVVEDNPVSQELILRLLRKGKHQISIANNGLEALALFDRGNFDIVLMDLEMPMMGGIATAEAIRAREMRRSWVIANEFKGTYIIAITANVMTDTRERCLEVGMNDFIGKPLNVDDLYAALERARTHTPMPLTPAEYISGPSTLADFVTAADQIGDKELLISMAEMFVSEWDENIAKLAEAITARSNERLHHQANSLRALLAMFHATEAHQTICHLCAQANGLNSPDWSSCDELMTAFEGIMNRTRSVFEVFLRT